MYRAHVVAFTCAQRRVRLLPATLCTSLFYLWFAVARASAGVGIGIAPTYPTSLEVGATNVAVSLAIENTSNGPQAAGTLTLNSIFHTPSCGSTSMSPCSPGNADNGVFLVKGPATGEIGTACAGKTFTIGPPDATTGEVEFVANGGPVVLQPTGTPGAECTIDFLVDMLRLPVKDASAAPGIQTAQLARVTATSSVESAQAGSTGSGLVTGSEQTQHFPSPAVSPAILGVVAILLGAYGAARLRRRAAAQPVRPR